MQYSKMRERILHRLSRHDTTSTVLDSLIISEIQAAEIRLEEEDTLPWFLETASSGLSTSASTATLALPTDFLNWVKDEPLLLTDSEGNVRSLKFVDYEDGFKAYGGSDEGVPLQVSVVGSDLHFWPTPKAAYDVSFRYMAASTKLADAPGDSDETSWMANAPELLMGEAGIVVAAVVRNNDAIALFKSLRDQGRKRLWARNITREELARNPTPVD